MMPQGPSDSLTVEFRDVDSASPDRILRCLDTLQSMEAGREYKARAGPAGRGRGRRPATGGALVADARVRRADLLFEIDVNARRLAPEFPEAFAWLESYRAGEAHAGVLMLTCWGRKI